MDDPHDGKGDNNDQDNALALGLALGISLGSGIGVALGAAIGAVTGNLGLCIALGISIGVGLGLAFAVIYADLQRRAGAGECPACGYPTKGLRTTVCPECGADLAQTPGQDDADEQMPTAKGDRDR